MTRICAHGEIMLRSRTQEKEIPHGRWLMHEHDLAHDLPGALLMNERGICSSCYRETRLMGREQEQELPADHFSGEILLIS